MTDKRIIRDPISSVGVPSDNAPVKTRHLRTTAQKTKNFSPPREIHEYLHEWGSGFYVEALADSQVSDLEKHRKVKKREKMREIRVRNPHETIRI